MADISITALHDPVSIVHIPLAAAAAAATKIYWTLDRAIAEAGEFFNLTSNRIEIALFAEADLVADEWGSSSDAGVQINGPWRVFEVASGDDGDSGENYDSPHLRHVSAPLAEAGISILYQSSYFTDFLLVKSSDFERASAIFRGQGWNCDPLLPQPSRRRSVLLASDLAGLLSARRAAPDDSASTPPVAEITVLSSPLVCIGLSPEVDASLSERLLKLLVWPERAVLAIEHARGKKADYAADAFDRRNSSPSNRSSLSPPHAGNGRTSIAAWASSRARCRPRPFMSYTRTEDGVSVMTEARVLRAMFSSAERANLGAPELEGSDSEWSDDDDEYEVAGRRCTSPQACPSENEDEDENGNGEGQEQGNAQLMSPSSSSRGRTGRAPLPSTSGPAHSGHSLRGGDSASGAEEIPIHWATPPSTPNSARFPGIGAFTPIMRSSSGSGGSGSERNSRRERSRVRHAEKERERARTREQQLEREEYAREASTSRYSSASRSSSRRTHARTRSETVTVGVLQHHAQVAGLGFIDPRVRRASEGLTREPWLADGAAPDESVVEENSNSSGSELDEEDEEDESPDPDAEKRARMMRCLQLDLRAVGRGAYHLGASSLDKSGLVTRFSDVLHRGGVRMLYSSTTHTANILVEGRDVMRAEKLLRD